MKMKKLRLIFLFCVACLLITSCTSTKIVFATSALNSANDAVELQMKQKGYLLSNKGSDTKNEVYVSGQSYSTYSGYGTLMENKLQKYDTYTFTNEDGNKISYTIKYSPKENCENEHVFYYVEDISLVGCEVTELGKYTEICGENGTIRRLYDNIPTTPIEVYDQQKTISATAFFTLIASLLVCAYAITL